MNPADADAALAGRLVWIFGSPRSGSTWLSRLLTAHPETVLVGEPHIGYHLAPLSPGLLDSRPLVYPEVQRDRPDYFFNDRTRDAWGPATRELILRRMEAEGIGPGKLAIVKEPHGSQAAETILSLLPESRLIFLLRDGRDVVDSEVAAYEPEGWLGRSMKVQVPRLQLVEFLARTWLLRTEIVERAYGRHDPERRHLVRYEELLADTEGQLSADRADARARRRAGAHRAHGRRSRLRERARYRPRPLPPQRDARRLARESDA